MCVSLDVVFIPEPYVKGITGNSIEIGWSPPPPDLKEHIHFYKLCLRNNETREEAVQHVDRSNAYMFINLHFAEMYFIKVTLFLIIDLVIFIAFYFL